MNLKRISAMLLAIVLVLSLGISAVSEEATMGESAPVASESEPAAGAEKATETEPVPDGENVPQAELVPEAENVPQVELVPYTLDNDSPTAYIFVFDAGYALYGTNFEDAIIKESGDPEGEIIQFVKLAREALINEKNVVVPVGHHSEVILVNGKTVKDIVNEKYFSWSNDHTVENTLFDAIINEPKEQRMSSLFYETNVTVEQLLGIINNKYKDFEIKVVYIHGGVVQKVRGKEFVEDEKFQIFQELEAIRQKAKIYSIGLDWSQTKYVSDAEKYAVNNVHTFFKPDEIIRVPVATTLMGEIDRTDTVNSVIKEIIRVLRGDQAKHAQAIPSVEKGTVKEVLKQLSPNDLVVLSEKTDEGNKISAKNVWEFEAELDQIDFEKASAIWVCSAEEIKDMTRFDMEKMFASVIDDIKEKTSSGIDKLEGSIEIAFPENFEYQKDMFTADGSNIECEVRNNTLILTAKQNGKGKLDCKFGDDLISIEISAIDSKINWNWNETNEYRIVRSSDENGEPSIAYVSNDETVNSFNIAVSADDLSWKIEEIIGANEGSIYEGEFAGNAQYSNQGIEWKNAKLIGDNKGVLLTFSRPGVYKVTCTSKNDGHEENVESRTIRVRVPLDDHEKINLIAPYFKIQPQQSVTFTSGGSAVALEDYLVYAPSGNVVSFYYLEGGSGLYLVPENAGSCEIEIREKYSENHDGIVVKVEVESLFSDVMLWVYTAGAALSLIGLTVAVTVIIGKSKRSK